MSREDDSNEARRRELRWMLIRAYTLPIAIGVLYLGLGLSLKLTDALGKVSDRTEAKEYVLLAKEARSLPKQDCNGRCAAYYDEISKHFNPESKEYYKASLEERSELESMLKSIDSCTCDKKIRKEREEKSFHEFLRKYGESPYSVFRPGF